MASTKVRTSGKVIRPSDGVRVPSAIGGRVLYRLQRAAVVGARGVVGQLGFDPHDPAARGAALGGDGAPAEQPPAPARYEQHVERPGRLVAELQGGGSLPGQHVVVVERRDQGVAVLLLERARDLLAAALGGVVQHDPGAVAFGGLALDHRRVQGHDDDGRDPEQPPGEGHALGVVAGGERDDAAAPFVPGQPRDGVVGAPELEGADPLEAFALQEDRGPQALVEPARGHDRRDVGHAAQPLGGIRDPSEKFVQ